VADFNCKFLSCNNILVHFFSHDGLYFTNSFNNGPVIKALPMVYYIVLSPTHNKYRPFSTKSVTLIMDRRE
jgi:hypothetical protein